MTKVTYYKDLIIFKITIIGLSLLEHQTQNLIDKRSAIPELVTKSGEIKILNYDCNTYYTRYQHRPPSMVDLVNNTIRKVTLGY